LDKEKTALASVEKEVKERVEAKRAGGT